MIGNLRVVIHFLAAQVGHPTKIYIRIKVVYGDYDYYQTAIVAWCNRFRKRSESANI